MGIAGRQGSGPLACLGRCAEPSFAHTALAAGAAATGHCLRQQARDGSLTVREIVLNGDHADTGRRRGVASAPPRARQRIRAPHTERYDPRASPLQAAAAGSAESVSGTRLPPSPSPVSHINTHISMDGRCATATWGHGLTAAAAATATRGAAEPPPYSHSREA